LRLNALKLINEFSKLGFTARSAFMAIVCHYFPKYKEKKENGRLSNWYYGKYADDQLHSDLELVLNKLKSE
jgi:hypothetical protein